MEIINGLGYKDPSLAASYIEIVFLNIFQVHAHSKLKSLMIIMKVTINSYYFVSFKKKNFLSFVGSVSETSLSTWKKWASDTQIASMKSIPSKFNVKFTMTSSPWGR